MHIHMDWPSTDAIRSSFQKVVDLGLKVKITELDIPYHNPHGGGDPKYPGYTVEFAEAQKKRYCEVVKTYMDTVPEEKRGGLTIRSEEHTSELQSRGHLVCRLQLEKKEIDETPYAGNRHHA